MYNFISYQFLCLHFFPGVPESSLSLPSGQYLLLPL